MSNLSSSSKSKGNSKEVSSQIVKMGVKNNKRDQENQLLVSKFNSLSQYNQEIGHDLANLGVVLDRKLADKEVKKQKCKKTSKQRQKLETKVHQNIMKLTSQKDFVFACNQIQESRENRRNLLRLANTISKDNGEPKTLEESKQYIEETIQSSQNEINEIQKHIEIINSTTKDHPTDEKKENLEKLINTIEADNNQMRQKIKNNHPSNNSLKQSLGKNTNITGSTDDSGSYASGFADDEDESYYSNKSKKFASKSKEIDEDNKSEKDATNENQEADESKSKKDEKIESDFIEENEPSEKSEKSKKSKKSSKKSDDSSSSDSSSSSKSKSKSTKSKKDSEANKEEPDKTADVLIAEEKDADEIKEINSEKERSQDDVKAELSKENENIHSDSKKEESEKIIIEDSEVIQADSDKTKDKSKSASDTDTKKDEKSQSDSKSKSKSSSSSSSSYIYEYYTTSDEYYSDERHIQKLAENAVTIAARNAVFLASKREGKAEKRTQTSEKKLLPIVEPENPEMSNADKEKISDLEKSLKEKEIKLEQLKTDNELAKQHLFSTFYVFGASSAPAPDAIVDLSLKRYNQCQTGSQTEITKGQYEFHEEFLRKQKEEIAKAAQIQQEYDQQKNRVTKTQELLAKASLRGSHLDTEIAKSKNKLKLFDANLEMDRQSLESVEKYTQKLHHKAKKLKAKLKNRQSMFTQIQNKISALEQKIEDLVAARAVLERDLKDTESKNKPEVVHLSEQVTHYSKKLESAENKMTTTRNDVNKLKQEIEELDNSEMAKKIQELKMKKFGLERRSMKWNIMLKNTTTTMQVVEAFSIRSGKQRSQLVSSYDKNERKRQQADVTASRLEWYSNLLNALITEHNTNWRK